MKEETLIMNGGGIEGSSELIFDSVMDFTK